ncbi:MAG: cyclic nucleotide-binding domain-containing protein [Betaproteobacteria bacterium]
MNPTLGKKEISRERQAIVDAMECCPLFQDWDSERIDKFSHFLKLEQYGIGQIVFEEGEPGNFMGVVASGKLSVRKFNSSDAQIELAKIYPARIFGEIALLDHERRSATVVALEDSSVLILTSLSLERLAEEVPPLALAFVKKIAIYLSKRMRTADGRLVDFLC